MPPDACLMPRHYAITLSAIIYADLRERVRKDEARVRAWWEV